jgi:signal transduction histidine kinase/CHASE3 domain sensor protein
MAFTVSNGKSWVIAGFIAATLALLTSFLLVLSYRTHAIITDLSDRADQAIHLGNKIDVAFSGEIDAIVGLQATGEVKYVENYQQRTQTVHAALEELEHLVPSLGPSVQGNFNELKAAIEVWNRDANTDRIASQRLPFGEFRRVVFDRLPDIRRAHQTMSEFNDAVVEYESQQRLRLDRVASLFRTLAGVFGPLALLSLVLIALILRRLKRTTFDLENHAREEESLREVAVSLTAGFRLDDVLARITEATANAALADGVFIQTVDPQKTSITCVSAYGSRVPAKGATRPLEGSIAQEVLQTRQPKIINNVDIDDRGSVIGELAHGGQSCTAMVVPLIAENEHLGAMFLTRPCERRFTYAELPKVRILADMASIALLRAVRVEEIQKMQDQANFLSESSKLLASSLDYSTTLARVVRLAVQSIADYCVVDLAENGRIYSSELAHSDPGKNAILERLRSKYRPRPDLPISVERVIQTRKAVLVPAITDELLREHSSDDEHFDLLRQLNMSSAMLVPLTAGDEILGAMVFVASGARHYDPDELSFAEECARHAAIAIRNARLYSDAQQAIRTRDEVFRMVSHDLRNPVTNIQITASLLSAASLPDESRQSMLQMIGRASERMSRLIEDLMTVGRMQQGLGIPIDIDRVDPAVIVDEVCTALGVQARAKGVNLHCSRPPSIPAIKADRNRVFQVLTNLVDNAVKFTPEGGKINLSCKVQNGEVQFAVKDTGSGVNSEDLAQMFNPFWQGRPGAQPGSGLGLAIAKAIVEEHHGRIWAESTPGVGTSVAFAIPLADAGREPVKPSAA